MTMKYSSVQFISINNVKILILIYFNHIPHSKINFLNKGSIHIFQKSNRILSNSGRLVIDYPVKIFIFFKCVVDRFVYGC